MARSLGVLELRFKQITENGNVCQDSITYVYNDGVVLAGRLRMMIVSILNRH